MALHKKDKTLFFFPNFSLHHNKIIQSIVKPDAPQIGVWLLFVFIVLLCLCYLLALLNFTRLRNGNTEYMCFFGREEEWLMVLTMDSLVKLRK